MTDCKAVCLIWAMGLGSLLVTLPFTVNFNGIVALHVSIAPLFILSAAFVWATPLLTRLSVVGVLLGFFPFWGSFNGVAIPHLALSAFFTVLLAGMLLVESACMNMALSRNLCQLEGGER